MNQAIDAALAPQEYMSDPAPAWSPGTITIEIEEHRKLMSIAGAVYAHLYQKAPESVLQEACDDYSVYCGVLTKDEMKGGKKEAEGKAKDAVMRALSKLDKAMQKGSPSQDIRKLCEDLISAYVRAMLMQRRRQK